MVSQRAIFVDAGFLLAVGGTQAAGTSLRSAFRVDFEKLIEGIMQCTERAEGLPSSSPATKSITHCPGACVMGIWSEMKLVDGVVDPGSGKFRVRPFNPQDQDLHPRDFDWMLPDTPA